MTYNKKALISTHDWIYPVYGGGGLRTLKVAEEFKKRNYEVVILAPSKINEINGMRVYTLAPPTKKRSQLLSVVKFNIKLLIYILKLGRDADIIFVHNTIAALGFFLLNKFLRKKIVLDVTDIHVEYLCGKDRLNIIERILRPLLLRIEYGVIKSADRVIVVTKAMKQRCIHKGVEGRKIKVIYDGADVDRFSAEKCGGADFNLIHLGLVDKQHGVPFIIQAMKIVLERFPNTKLYVVGSGRNLPYVKKLADESGVYQSCIFTGTIDHAEVGEALRKAGIGIIPRPDNLANNMVITLKLLEYWASGTAVVSSRLSGISEIAEDKKNILFFEPGDHYDLASKINFLLANPQELAKMQKNSREAATRFDWKRIIPEIVDTSLN